jgi:hypothetical protein
VTTWLRHKRLDEPRFLERHHLIRQALVDADGRAQRFADFDRDYAGADESYHGDTELWDTTSTDGLGS